MNSWGNEDMDAVSWRGSWESASADALTSGRNWNLQESLDHLSHLPPLAGFSVYDAGKGEIALHCDVFNRFVRMRDTDKVATELHSRDRGVCAGEKPGCASAAPACSEVQVGRGRSGDFSHDSVTTNASHRSARMPAALPRPFASCA